MSTDGRFVAFMSSASGLVAGDTNGVSDAFVVDRQTNVTWRVSVSTSGAQANGESSSVSLSPDGRYVLFSSVASNLVSGDTNGVADVFLRDRQTGVTERVSVAGAATQGNGESSADSTPAVSSDGRYVAFSSSATNLVSGDTNAVTDVFVRDRQAATTQRVSVGVLGVQANDISSGNTLTPDGRYVVFPSKASNLVSGDTNGRYDLFLRDRQSGTTERLSVKTGGGEAGFVPGLSVYAYPPSISADGRYVAFESDFPDLVPSDGVGTSDVFVRDRVANQTELISISTSGFPSGSHSRLPVISPDGRYVAFKSEASNLIPNDMNGIDRDVFLRDRQTAATSVVSVSSEGLQGSYSGGIGSFSHEVAISSDLRYLAFDSQLDDLVVGDVGGDEDVFVIDRAIGPPDPSPGPIPLEQTFGGCENSLGSLSDPGCLEGDGGDFDESVDGANGGLAQGVTDVRLAGRGITFSFTRSYSSADDEVGRLGPGWTHPYQAAAFVYPNGDVGVRAEDGQEGIFVRQADGSFATPAGLTATLAASAGGYTLTSLDQTRLSFDATGRLTQMVDATAQGLSFAYTGGDMTSVTDAEGKQVGLAYDPTSHRLTGISLPDGRSVSYGYLPDGRLGSVTDLRGGVTTYTYDGAGRLNGVRDPLNHWAIRVVYDASGRVIERRDALDNVTTYSSDAGTGTHTRTDPRGGVWREVYSGNVLVRRIDPLGNTTVYGYDDRLNQTSITDPRGNTTYMAYDQRGNMITRVVPSPLSFIESWTYDAGNRPLSYTNGRGHTTSYEYYLSGDLWKETDAKGGVTEYTYTPERQVATIKDPRGNTTSNTYDAATKKLIRVTTPLGNATVYEYDAFGRLSAQIDPRGQMAGADPNLFKTTYTYNDADQRTGVRDPRGNLTTTAYDLAGNELSVTDARGKVTSYGYDAANRRTSVTDPNNGVTQTDYDAAGNISAQVSPTGDRTTFSYDLVGRQTSMTTPRGNAAGATPSDYTWQYTYDANGNRTVARDPLGNETTTSYDRLNRPVTVTDPRGKTTTTGYDANGNVVSVSNPLGEATTSSYDELNRKLSQTTPRGKTTTFSYDAVGNTLSETTPLGNKTTWTYDADNRQATMVEARGNVTGGNPATYTWTYTYDPAGNRLSERSPLNHTTAWTYDGANNQTTKTDALAHLTTWTYDELNRLRGVTGPDAPTCSAGAECVGGKKSTVYGYDDAGNLTTRTDPNAHATTYSYDLSRRLTEVLSPIGQRWTYGYDRDGNQSQVVTGRGNASATPATGTITKAYDPRGKLTGIAFGDGGTPNVAFGYDNAGRLTSMSDGAGSEAYTLDDAGRITQITRGGESFSYSYDPDGNPTSRTYPDTTAHTATFDDDGRLATITSGGVVASFTYDAAGNLTRTTLPSGNGHVENRTFDAAGRITQVESVDGNKVLVRATQTLDAVGNPTLIATRRGNTTTNQTYAYDAADRITRNCLDITATCTASAAKRIEYTYDPIGNRLTQNRVGVTSPGSITYTYNNADQLTQTVAGATTTPYSYDADGNQTSAGSSTYTYDLTNHLATAVSGATTTVYTYDGQGRRLTRATNGTTDTKFSWDRIGPLPELALERTNTNGLIRRYIQGPDGPMSFTTTAGTFYYHRDPIGSIRSVTSSTGAEQWRHDYDPFGENRSTTKVVTSAPANPVQYAGEALDTETGLYHIRVRQYDPATGRFTAVDPVPQQLTDPFVASYVYGSARPTVLTDPTGQCPVCVALVPAAVSAVIGAITVATATYYGAQLAGALYYGADPYGPATNLAAAIIPFRVPKIAQKLVGPVFSRGGFIIRAAVGGGKGLLIPRRQLQHSSRHWAEIYGKGFTYSEARATIVLKDIAAAVRPEKYLKWRVRDSKRGWVETEAYLHTINGKPVLVQFYADGAQKGQFVTLFRPKGPQLGAVLSAQYRTNPHAGY